MRRLFRIGIVPLSPLALMSMLFQALCPSATVGAMTLGRLAHEGQMLAPLGCRPEVVPVSDSGGTPDIITADEERTEVHGVAVYLR